MWAWFPEDLLRLGSQVLKNVILKPDTYSFRAHLFERRPTQTSPNVRVQGGCVRWSEYANISAGDPKACRYAAEYQAMVEESLA